MHRAPKGHAFLWLLISHSDCCCSWLSNSESAKQFPACVRGVRCKHRVGNFAVSCPLLPLRKKDTALLNPVSVDASIDVRQDTTETSQPTSRWWRIEGKQECEAAQLQLVAGQGQLRMKIKSDLPAYLPHASCTQGARVSMAAHFPFWLLLQLIIKQWKCKAIPRLRARCALQASGG